MAKSQNLNRFSPLIVILLTVFLSGAIYFSDHFSFWLRTSVVGLPEHAPFDGTTYPLKKAPDWVSLKSTEWTQNYSDFDADDLVVLPYYDPAQLATSVDDLKWGDPEDDAVRNAKITYSVPYLGSYLLNGIEGAGSHPAVDIKVPVGTPVFAIANGVVVKTSELDSGFGYHTVLQHNNFPSLNDPNAKETIYSSYSHMSGVLVKEGDVVKKGYQIGLTGETGTATTPHLHFQIDNSDAPWHPYWPFTWAEISEAGLDFFSAINEGFGAESAASTTINPLKYVQTYLDAAPEVENAVEASSEVVEEATEVVEEPVVADEPVADDEPVAADEPVAETVNEPVVVEDVVAEDVEKELVFEFDVLDTYYDGQKGDFSVYIRDQFGNPYTEMFDGTLVISGVNSRITANQAIIDRFDFDDNGKFSNSFERTVPGRERLLLEYNGETYYSDWFDIVENSDVASFSDVPADSEYYDAVTYLVSEGVVAGYPDGTFAPDQAVSRVEALKFIYEGINETLSDGDVPFLDVSLDQWYGKYLATAYKEKVVDGYPDGTFKPTNSVNKAEFYKILFNGMGVDINPVVEKGPFTDVSKDDWFAHYVAYAKEIGVIDSSVKELHPSDSMTRGEVANAIYRLMILMK